MGRDKALLLLDNQTLLARALKKMRLLFDEVIIVTNQPCKYKFSGVREVTDIYPGRGPLGGIHAGLKAARFDKVFFVACDMPFWEPGLVRPLLEASADFDGVVPRNGCYLEPLFAIYTKTCLPVIENCLERNVFKVIEFLPLVRINYVEDELLKTGSTLEKAFININTLEDFYAYRRISLWEPDMMRSK
jgi:molybdopterin-guanine dinucleotide biosynthesis protein A